MSKKIASELLDIAREIVSGKKRRKKKPLSRKDRMKVKEPTKTRGQLPPSSFSHKDKKTYNRQKSKSDVRKEMAG